MPSTQQISTTPEAEKDRWRTPPWLFRYLSWRYGPFDIDLAAGDENHLCERYFTIETNALAQNWFHYGARGFCNPPYSAPSAWVASSLFEAQGFGFSTCLVLPTHINQKWAALSQHATEVLNFEGRVQFLRADGTPAKTSNRGGTQVIWFRAGDLGFTRTPWVKTSEIRERFEDKADAMLAARKGGGDE